jgi:hypothetical protein
MTRTIPAHVSPSHVLAAAERLFRASALKHSHSECRNREIKEADIQHMAAHKTAVFVHDLRRMLESGGADDYCI